MSTGVPLHTPSRPPLLTCTFAALVCVFGSFAHGPPVVRHQFSKNRVRLRLVENMPLVVPFCRTNITTPYLSANSPLGVSTMPLVFLLRPSFLCCHNTFHSLCPFVCLRTLLNVVPTHFFIVLSSYNP